MGLAVEQGKAYAQGKLQERREANANIDRSAGSLSNYFCLSCSELVEIEEGNTSPDTVCAECRALIDEGWMIDR